MKNIDDKVLEVLDKEKDNFKNKTYKRISLKKLRQEKSSYKLPLIDTLGIVMKKKLSNNKI